MLAGAGAEVHHVVGGADRALVVLDHDHGVAEVPQPSERVDQLLVVALVEPDRGLVEDVKDAHERRADLGGEPDPLRLTAGERVGRPLERQVADPDAVEEPQPLRDLAHDEPRDGALRVRQLQVLDPLEGRARRQLRVLIDVEPADRDREALRPQPSATARRARLQRHQALDPLAGVVRVGVLVAPLEALQHAVEAHRVGPLAAEPVAVADGVLVRSGAVEQQLAVLLHQVLPGGLDIDPVGLGDRLQEAPVIHGCRLDPWLKRPLADRQCRVRHDQLRIDHSLEAQAVAARAATVGGVEGEDPRLELGHRRAAVEARELLREHQHLAALAGAGAAEDLHAGRLVAVADPARFALAIEEFDLDDALGELRRGLNRLGEALAEALLHHQPVDHHRDVVLVLLVELDVLVEAPELAVDHGADVALSPHLLELAPVLALATAHDRRQHHEPRPIIQRHHPVGYLLQ